MIIQKYLLYRSKKRLILIKLLLVFFYINIIWKNKKKHFLAMKTKKKVKNQ